MDNLSLKQGRHQLYGKYNKCYPMHDAQGRILKVICVVISGNLIHVYNLLPNQENDIEGEMTT